MLLCCFIGGFLSVEDGQPVIAGGVGWLDISIETQYCIVRCLSRSSGFGEDAGRGRAKP